MDAILLVAGFDTRLLPLTKQRVKPLLPLANIPFTERTIGWLASAGIEHVILNVQYNTAQFVEHFTNKELGVRITFVQEKRPQGTASALRHCARHLQSTQCLVVNGDIFTDLNLPAFMTAHRRTHALVTIALNSVTDPARFGLVEVNPDMGIRAVTEQPAGDAVLSNEINAGVYLLERRAFEHFPAGATSLERDVFPVMLQQDLPLFGFRSRSYWSDLGTPQEYLQAHQEILNRRVIVALRGTEMKPGVWVGDYTRIAANALLRAPLLLGNRVTIEAGAVVGPNVVLGDNVHIGPQARVRDSVLWEGADVQANSVIADTVAGQQAQLSGVITGGLCADFGTLDHTVPVRTRARSTKDAAPAVSLPTA